MNYEVYFLHADKHWSLQQDDTIILRECNQACPKHPKWVCISLQYLHKSMGDEVEVLPADKHKSFLQDGNITLCVISQTNPKYQKQSVYNIFAISQGKYEGWSWFFTCWKMLKIFSNRYYHFRCVWLGMSKLPKITNLLFLYNMLRKSEWCSWFFTCR